MRMVFLLPPWLVYAICNDINSGEDRNTALRYILNFTGFI